MVYTCRWSDGGGKKMVKSKVREVPNGFIVSRKHDTSGGGGTCCGTLVSGEGGGPL